MEEKVAGWTDQRAHLLGRSGQERRVLVVGGAFSDLTPEAPMANPASDSENLALKGCTALYRSRKPHGYWPHERW